MGGVMHTPITRKESDWGPQTDGLGLAWASSCMQGWREGMEDAHICIPKLPNFGGGKTCKNIAMFGVMDGHGGEQVAKFCDRHLPEEICVGKLDGSRSEIKDALVNGFHRIDDMLRDTAKSLPELQALTNKPTDEGRGTSHYGPGRSSHRVDVNMVGCTCCICVITETEFIVANAGDSRAVLCRKGLAVALSEDHKPNDPTERRRIQEAGGFVEAQRVSSGTTQYRVNGNLNLSRALGDLQYKKDRTRGPEQQIISGTPDVEFFERTAEDEFVIICCDGVWDVKTNQQVVDFVRTRLSPLGNSWDPRKCVKVLEQLLDDCISRDLTQSRGLGGDNMTAVIVLLPTMQGPSDAPNQGLGTKLLAEGASQSPMQSLPPTQRKPTFQLVSVTAEEQGDDRGDNGTRTGGSSGTIVGGVTTGACLHGCLVVHVAPVSAECSAARPAKLIEAPKAANIEVWLREASVELEVADSAGDVDAGRFDLTPHLPEGATLDILSDDGHKDGRRQANAKFYKKSGSVCIRLPWTHEVRTW